MKYPQVIFEWIFFFFVESTQIKECASNDGSVGELKKAVLQMVNDNFSFEGILREVSHGFLFILNWIETLFATQEEIN